MLVRGLSSARSSAQYRSLRHEKGVHLVSVAWPAVACLIIQSMVGLKSNADWQQLCLAVFAMLKIDIKI